MLKGSTLRVDPPLGFSIHEEGAFRKHHFKVDGEELRNDWLASLKEEPGIYRVLEDYYSLGPVIGEGATCRVRQVTSKLDGKVYALKQRLDITDVESCKSMYNELKLLQMIACDYHSGLPLLYDYFVDHKGNIEVRARQQPPLGEQQRPSPLPLLPLHRWLPSWSPAGSCSNGSCSGTRSTRRTHGTSSGRWWTPRGTFTRSGSPTGTSSPRTSCS